jgi:acetyl-CoA carboxylase carboxyl transferase subunit beta
MAAEEFAKLPPDVPDEESAPRRKKRGVPEGLWQRCPGCSQPIFRKQAEEQHSVCPECGYHWYVSASARLAQILDDGTFEEWDADLMPTDPLEFADKALARFDDESRRRTGRRTA